MFRLYSLNWQVYPLRREFGHVEFFFFSLNLCFEIFCQLSDAGGDFVFLTESKISDDPLR